MKISAQNVFLKSLLSASSRQAHPAFYFSINLRKYIENFQRVGTKDRTNQKKKKTKSKSFTQYNSTSKNIYEYFSYFL